jgi:2-polyprenyl-3-methyl-5-hydroxy-6-metoxy-1,4-benzoquinol methylase
VNRSKAAHPIALEVRAALDARYGLARKRAAEPDIDRVLGEFVDRLRRAFGSLERVRGKRILDIACGSNSSRSPDTGERTSVFEPWFCRVLLELGADPVGVDAGDLEGEHFEHHRADLSKIGALDFLAAASFDGIQDSRLFGSPEFLALLPRSEHAPIKAELRRQEKRLLRPGGVIIHSDNP